MKSLMVRVVVNRRILIKYISSTSNPSSFTSNLQLILSYFCDTVHFIHLKSTSTPIEPKAVLGSKIWQVKKERQMEKLADLMVLNG